MRGIAPDAIGADRKGTPPEFPSLVALASRALRIKCTDVVQKGAGRMPGFAQLGDAAVNAIVRLHHDGRRPARQRR